MARLTAEEYSNQKTTREHMSEATDGSKYGILALAGVCGLCCLSLGVITGGAAVAGGAAAGVTVWSGLVQSLGGLVVTVIATALPLVVIGLFLRHRTLRDSP